MSRTSVVSIDNCICQNHTMFFFHNSANCLFLDMKNLISYLQRLLLCSALCFVLRNSRCISSTVFPCKTLKIWRKAALDHQDVVCSILHKKLFPNVMFPILVSSGDLIFYSLKLQILWNYVFAIVWLTVFELWASSFNICCFIYFKPENAWFLAVFVLNISKNMSRNLSFSSCLLCYALEIFFKNFVVTCRWCGFYIINISLPTIWCLSSWVCWILLPFLLKRYKFLATSLF